MTREEAVEVLKERYLTCVGIGLDNHANRVNEAIDMAIEALSADAEPKMTEEVREALMRLTMCAREECAMCKYKDKCGFEFQYNISTENMNTLLCRLYAQKICDDPKETHGGKERTMSVSKWNYEPDKCDGHYCPGDCDLCNLEGSEDESRSEDTI